MKSEPKAEAKKIPTVANKHKNSTFSIFAEHLNSDQTKKIEKLTSNMRVSDLTALLKNQFKINGEICLMINAEQTLDPKLTLEQSEIKEGVKVVVNEILVAQPNLTVPT
jgi:hypothetical protein